jgi:isoamylase
MVLAEMPGKTSPSRGGRAERRRRRRFFTEGEILWLRPDGEHMTADDWNTPSARALAASPADHRFLLLVNGWWEPLTFTLPAPLRQQRLSVAVDTTPQSGPARVGPGDEVTVGARALMLLEKAARGRQTSAVSPS